MTQTHLVLLCDHSPSLRLPRTHTPVRLPGCVTHLPSYLVPELLVTHDTVAVACEHRTDLLDRLPLAEVPPTHRWRAAGERDVDNYIDLTGESDDRFRAAMQALGLWDSPAAELVARGCTACAVCVHACPTDALTLTLTADGDEPTATLNHDRTRCDNTGQCLDLCPVEALHSLGPAPITGVREVPAVTLATVAVTRCAKCSQYFRTDGATLCPTCSYRRDNPFGSTLPPGFSPR